MDSPQQDGVPSAEACECLIEAYNLAEEGRLGGAAQKVERALELVPNWSQAHGFYGMLLEEMGFVGKARLAYDRAARPDALSFDIPRSSSGLRPRRAAASSPPEGSRDPGAAAEGPGRPQGLLDAARAAWGAGKLGGALRACASALAADPDWAEAHNLRGLILDDLGHPEEAAAAYLEAVRLDPSLAEARRNLLRAGAVLEVGDDSLDLVVIRAFSFPSEAEIARGRLEAEEIPAIITQSEIVDMNWTLSNAVGGVKLCVREQDVEKALAVLDWDVDAVHPDMRCPSCGSGRVSCEGYEPPWGYGLIELVRRVTVAKKKRWACQSCGANWKEVED